MNTGNLLSSRWAPASSTSTATRSHSTSRTSTPLRSTSPAKTTSSQAQHQYQYHHPTLINNATGLPIPLTGAQQTHLDRLTHLRTATRHLRRLHHKSHLLLYSHAAALQQQSQPYSSNSNSDHVIGGHHFSTAKGEAEMMFRVDFFEWYVLLERCLVALLAGVGVVVSAGFDPAATRRKNGGDYGEERKRDGGALAAAGENGSGNLIGDKNVFVGYAHRFHQNVLEALDVTEEEGNLLHGVLGMGQFREYLGLCKAFRNRWKDAEVGDAEDARNNGEMGEDAMRQEEERSFERRLKRYQNLLRDLQLDEMLGCLLEGLERAKTLTEGELNRRAQEVGLPAAKGSHLVNSMQAEMEIDLEYEEREAWNGGTDDMMEWD